MSDIKSVIALLCKHLNLSIGSSFKPEYFRLAKYNTGDEHVTQALWTVLHTLGHLALQDQELHIEFDRYDDLHTTKLYFSFLQYPTIDFYALSKKSISCNRELLIAFGWLIATKNVLNIAIREKLRTSVLSQEYSCTDDSTVSDFIETKEKMDAYVSPVNTKSRMNTITHTCGRVNHNIKEIAELLQEKIKLTTKVHGATLNTSGLPHLSVSQVAMTKKILIEKKQNFTKKDEQYLQELEPLAIILDTHNQWIKVEHVFYDWMVTIIEESKSKKESLIALDRSRELSNFISLLRHVTKKKLHSLKTDESTKKEQVSLYEESCASRFFQTRQKDTDAELWYSKTTEQLKTVDADNEIKMAQLTSELRKMFKSIENCVEI